LQAADALFVGTFRVFFPQLEDQRLLGLLAAEGELVFSFVILAACNCTKRLVGF